MKKQQGFTLIELMIVVAIIAILAAIALPAYSAYVKKTKVSEVILAASASRTALSEYVASNNALPPNTWAPESNQTQYVESVTWDGSTITATARQIDPAINGQTIQLQPVVTAANLTAGIIPEWRCGGSIPSEFRPGSCQDTITED